MVNSVDPDEMPRSAASHLGLHCLSVQSATNIRYKSNRMLVALAQENLLISYKSFLHYALK